ncbi:ATP-dependent helicase [Sedimentibacter saalensis]|uniref:ATP-dependent helicase n=1 Tax=Sedimentibacter saalensis TaxID=130788 RepID=UPI0028A1ABDE|nr:ATP-dependent helicase [Sedimentibacter saalensis]
MEYFDYLKDINGVVLNSQQMEAASFDKGNALVLSTAGSGKTTVTIARTGRLLYENKCSRKVLTITFSKMAANDMKNRFQSYFGSVYKSKTEFSTIHAFSYKIVKSFYNRKGIDFELLTNSYHILGEILKSHYSKSYFNYVSDEEIENLSSAIGFVNNMMINPAEYKDYGIEIKGFDTIYETYRTYKSKNRLIDFDDMLLFAYKIIKSSDYYRDYIKNTYQYVQIDEMQDTSKIQHEIIKLITDDNLFMVGDDDQAIYSFRGSYPDFMLEFKDIYKDGKVFYLDNNYRSDKNIVEGARHFIERNKKRYIKAINTDNERKNEINIIRVKNRAEQARLITDALSKSSDETVGILFRYNMSAMILANNLNENKIDFYIKEDKTKFFSNPVLYDVLAFLNLAINPKDRDAFSRIYYKSYTYFSKGMCKIVTDSPREDLTVFDILDNYRYFDHYVYDKIKQFKIDINYLNKLRPMDAIRFIKMELEYINYLERMQEEGRNNMSNSLHILEILEEIGSYCKNIKEFIEKINNLQDVIKSASENINANVTLTTIHSAKGLEYDFVYMIDNLSGEFPSEKKNMSDDDYEKILEEERRIFYVGMTRAKKVLNIIVPGATSLFVNELIQSNKKNIV